MSLDKQKEIEPETFWEYVGAISMVMLLVLQALPFVPFVVWIALLPTDLKFIGAVGTFAFIPIWLVYVLRTTDHYQRYIRKAIVKDMIREKQKRQETRAQHSENIAELKEWLHKKGYHFKGETEDDRNEPRREENVGQT